MGRQQTDCGKLLEQLMECQIECEKLKKIEMARARIDKIDDERRFLHRKKQQEFLNKLNNISDLKELENWRIKYIKFLEYEMKLEDEYENAKRLGDVSYIRDTSCKLHEEYNGKERKCQCKKTGNPCK